MEAITLQMLELELGNCKRIDLQKKVDIAVNIIERISETSFWCDTDRSFLDQVSRLTGVNTTVLQEIRELEEASRKFSQYTIEIDVSGSKNILYATMKKYLHDSYTKDRKIPTKAVLLTMFKDMYREDFRVIFNKYFTTIPVAGTKHSIIVEKPEIVLRRHRYLQKKMELVKAGKVFVYIEEICFMSRSKTLWLGRPKNNKTKRMLLAVSPELGYVDSIYCTRTSEVSFRHLLEDKIIPKVPPGCVFVFEDSLFENVLDPPESHSSKQDMIEWLRQKDIPHASESHRAELYALVKKYKKSYRNVTKAEQVLKVRGHDVLCRGEGVVFEYFEPFWKKLHELLDPKGGPTIVAKPKNKDMPVVAESIISQIQNEYWYELGRQLLDAETNCQKNDEEMEHVIDKLMIFAESKQFKPKQSEFEEYCKALHHEYIFS